MFKKEFSFGIIPLRKRDNIVETLLVKHAAGHWAFPKGHPEEAEEPQQTAMRELEEEVGLKVKQMLSLPPLKEHYFFMHNKQRIEKTVLYFVAFVEGEIRLQATEVQEARWVPLDKGSELATFKETKNVCRQVLSFQSLENFSADL